MRHSSDDWNRMIWRFGQLRFGFRVRQAKTAPRTRIIRDTVPIDSAMVSNSMRNIRLSILPVFQNTHSPASRVARILLSTSQHSADFFEQFGAYETSRIENGWGVGMHRIDMEIDLPAS